MASYAYERKVSPSLSVTRIRKKYLWIGPAANDTHPGRVGKIGSEETEGNGMINESCVEINTCCPELTSGWAHGGGGPTQESAQALARVNDRKGKLARTLLIIRWCLPSPVCLPRKVLWLPACLRNDELHLTVITQPRSHRNSECCIFKSGPSDTIFYLSSQTSSCLMRSDHPPRGPQTCCLITVSWLAHGGESPSPLSHIDLPPSQLTNQRDRIMCRSVSACVFTHPAAPSIPATLPKRLPGPYLICTHQSSPGPGWQAHFSRSAWSRTAAMCRTNQAPRAVL